MDVEVIEKSDARYPAGLLNQSGVPSQLFLIGDAAILKRPAVGLICSVQCPGSVVIKTFDVIRELRDAGIILAGGFHSPMEQECLGFLLRGKQPIIICPARHPSTSRLENSWRSAIEAGRLLILSPFASHLHRTTKANAQARNEFVGALSAAVLVPHASPGGKALATAQRILNRNQPLFTIADDQNQCLIDLGGRPYDVTEIKHVVAASEAKP